MRRSRWAGGVSLAFAALLSGCASQPTLVGTWNLHLPRHQTRVVAIENFGHGRYYLHGHTLMDGLYRKEGKQLICVTPNDPRLSGFVWRIEGRNKLILVAQPRLWVSQERYLGDALTRKAP